MSDLPSRLAWFFFSNVYTCRCACGRNFNVRLSSFMVGEVRCPATCTGGLIFVLEHQYVPVQENELPAWLRKEIAS